MSAQRLASLTSAVPRARVAALRTLLQAPDPSPPIVAAVTALLDDTTPTILSLPIRIGEVRSLAAEVLAATRALVPAQAHDVVILDPAWDTLAAAELAALATRAGVAHLDPPAQYAWLRDHGVLTRHRRTLHPLTFLV